MSHARALDAFAPYEGIQSASPSFVRVHTVLLCGELDSCKPRGRAGTVRVNAFPLFFQYHHPQKTG